MLCSLFPIRPAVWNLAPGLRGCNFCSFGLGNGAGGVPQAVCREEGPSMPSVSSEIPSRAFGCFGLASQRLERPTTPRSTSFLRIFIFIFASFRCAIFTRRPISLHPVQRKMPPKVAGIPGETEKERGQGDSRPSPIQPQPPTSADPSGRTLRSGGGRQGACPAHRPPPCHFAPDKDKVRITTPSGWRPSRVLLRLQCCPASAPVSGGAASRLAGHSSPGLPTFQSRQCLSSPRLRRNRPTEAFSRLGARERSRRRRRAERNRVQEPGQHGTRRSESPK
jgi:hypothetical protein